MKRYEVIYRPHMDDHPFIAKIDKDGLYNIYGIPKGCLAVIEINEIKEIKR